MTTSRRSIITGLVALVAAPAIIKVASVMPINSGLVSDSVSMRLLADYESGVPAARLDVLYGTKNSLLTTNAITRDAVQLFRNSNEFVKNLDRQYDAEFAANYVFYDGEQWGGRYLAYDKQRRTIVERLPLPTVPVVVAPLALATAALVAAPEILKTPVTRRFWDKVKA